MLSVEGIPLITNVTSKPDKNVQKTGMFYRILYFTRVVTYLMAMIPGLILVYEKNFSPYYYAYLIFICICMPHIEELIRYHTDFYKKIDQYLFISPAFWSAVLTGALDYSVYIFLGVSFLSYLGPLIVAGTRYIYKYLIASAAGLIIGGFVTDYHFDQSIPLSVQLVCVGNVLVYCAFLAFGMYLNSNYLKKSRDVLYESTNINKIFNKIYKDSNVTLSIDNIMQSLLAAFSSRYFESIAFLVYNEEHKQLEVTFFEGVYTNRNIENTVKEIKIPVSTFKNKDSFFLKAFNQNKILYQDQIFEPEKLSEIDYEFYSLIPFRGLFIIPISAENRMPGLLAFFSVQKTEKLKPMQLDLLRTYFLQLSVIINNAQTHKKLIDEIHSIEVETSHFEKLHSELSKYLSPKIYERVFQSNVMTEIANQFKFLTIFSSDIVGFTDLSERLEPEEMTQMLNYYLNEMTNIAFKYDATVDKYIGDSIQIFFGDPLTHGKAEDAIRCCEMAMEMQEKVKSLQLIWNQYGISKQLIIRIGIHSDFCSVGNFGSKYHMQYSIVGEPVDIANDLQSKCTPGQVLISKNTAELVKSRFNFKKIEIDGEPLYEIIRNNQDA